MACNGSTEIVGYCDADLVQPGYGLNSGSLEGGWIEGCSKRLLALL